MKLYALYSPSHERLLREWFLPSLKDDFELVIREIPQWVPEGRWGEDGWMKAMRAKVELILEACAQSDRQPFVHSDVDVQFFRPVKGAIEEALRDHDIVFQRDDPRGMVCCGFFAAYPGPAVAALFRRVLAALTTSSKLHDQELVNRLLIEFSWTAFVLRHSWLVGLPTFGFFPKLRNEFGVRWKYLPACFQSGGTLTGRHWRPG
ncbi:MAG: putative nucleotide-diphospho-sugar transferase, partial [Candidatus Binatia bacterium]